jgi:hypothetical protein
MAAPQFRDSFMPKSLYFEGTPRYMLAEKCVFRIAEMKAQITRPTCDLTAGATHAVVAPAWSRSLVSAGGHYVLRVGMRWVGWPYRLCNN